MKRHRAREIPAQKFAKVVGAVACLARSLRRGDTNLRSTFCCAARQTSGGGTPAAARGTNPQQPSQLAPLLRPPPRPVQLYASFDALRARSTFCCAARQTSGGGTPAAARGTNPQQPSQLAPLLRPPPRPVQLYASFDALRAPALTRS
jgi:hypothetical protein